MRIRDLFDRITNKPKAGDVKIACIGDSITYGYGVRHRLRCSYPAVLGDLLGEGYFVRNFGFSGRTASREGDHPYFVERLYRKSLLFLPDIAVIMLGTNDAKPFNWRGADAFLKDLEAMIVSYRTLPSHPDIILLVPPPVWAYKGPKVWYDIDPQILENELCPAVRRLAAEEGLPLVDLNDKNTWTPDLFRDGVHPNVAGARHLAESVFKAIHTKELSV